MSRSSRADRPPPAELEGLRVPAEARLAAKVCAHWEQTAQQEVLAWIQARLAHPSARTRRQKQLWLVHDMVSGANVDLFREHHDNRPLELVCALIEEKRTLPTAAAFDEAARLLRLEHYEVPYRKQLTSLVGGNWAEVCQRAAELVVHRTSDRSKTRRYDGASIPPKGTYWRPDQTVVDDAAEATPNEQLDRIARGLLWALDFFGYPPLLEEYLHFAVAERRLAVRLDQLEPLLATKKPLLSSFVDFDRALEYAMMHKERLSNDDLGIKVRLRLLPKHDDPAKSEAERQAGREADRHRRRRRRAAEG